MVAYTDQSPRETYTIAGQTFQIPAPYTAGYALTEGEADALNQTLAENVRNNLASKIKDAVAAGAFNSDEFQLSVDEYIEGYEFGVRGGGGRTSDPVKQEFMLIARDKIKQKIKSTGGSLKDYKAKQITELAEQYWDSRSTKAQAVLELAQRRVKERQEIADLAIDELPSAPTAEPAQAAA